MKESCKQALQRLPAKGVDARQITSPLRLKKPGQIDPSIAREVNQSYEHQKAAGAEYQKAQAQENYQKAVEENKARMSLGVEPAPLPPAPPVMPQYKQTMDTSPVAQPPSQEDQNFMAKAQDQNMGMLQKGYEQQKAGISKEAAAQTGLGQSLADVARKQQDQVHGLMNDTQEHFEKNLQERQDLISAVKANQINPNHYMESLGALGKIGTSIGMFLSGFGSNITHQPNMASDFLNNQIKRDIDAQEKNLGIKETLLSYNLKTFGNIRDAMDMTRLMQSDIYQEKIKEAMANAQGPLAQAQGEKLLGQLNEQYAPKAFQMSMRQAALKGLHGGKLDPSLAIQYRLG